MHRYNLYITDEQRAWLERESERVDVTHAEIVRRALDYWISLKSSPLQQSIEVLSGEPYPDPVRQKPFVVEIRERLELIEAYMLANLTPEGAETLKEDAELRRRELLRAWCRRRGRRRLRRLYMNKGHAARTAWPPYFRRHRSSPGRRPVPIHRIHANLRLPGRDCSRRALG